MTGTEKAEANFRAALARLEEFADLDREAVVTQTAIIKAFEFTWETAWKCARSMALDQGQEVNGPRESQVFALQSGLIPRKDEKTWLVMPKDRNLSAHVYLPDVANSLVPRIVTRHLPAFRRLRDRLDAIHADETPDQAPLN